MSDAPQCRFVWYDLMTTDTDQGKAFYTALFGWETQAWEGPMVYDMWTNRGVPMGGIMELPDDARKGGVPANWLTYIGVEDLEAAVASATSLGGTILVDPTEIPSAGAFAVLADPQGAAFAVYRTGADDATSAGKAQVGDVSWHELATTDYESAFAYYHALFGWGKGDAMDMGDAGTYQLFHCAGMGGGMFNKPDEMPGPAFWLYYIKVGDIEKSVAKVRDLGGQVVNGPMEVPGGDQVAQCLDPQGAAFAMHWAGG